MTTALVIDSHVHVPDSAIRVTAARASGPGGQNVNKVSSKVDMRVDPAGIVGLDGGALARLLVLTRTRLDAEGRIQLVSQRTRDQAKNIADALEKLRLLIVAALVPPVPRKATKPSRGAVRARLRDKKHAATQKQGRVVRFED